jgi:uncharacterized protein YdhG (YjbR/CyaY superfamily)
MQSNAATVDEYLDSLPADRREALKQVRAVIKDNLPDGLVEAMDWGMISYEVPLETYPDTYNGRPLMYAALASQKNHMAVYLTGIYADAGLRDAFLDEYRATGKRPDAGKSCVRFKELDDLPLEVIGRAVAAVDLPAFLAQVEAAGSVRKSKKARAGQRAS